MSEGDYLSPSIIPPKVQKSLRWLVVWIRLQRRKAQKSETSMEQRIQSAAIIAAALLRDYPAPSTDKIVELMTQALEVIDITTGLENRRAAKKSAELKMNTLQRR